MSSFDHLDPAAHADVMIEACNGDAFDALGNACTNEEFAPDDDARKYWDRVGAAIAARIAEGCFA
jgi:hypothetical protein